MMTSASTPPDSSRLEDFSRYFDLSLAVTRSQRAQVYRIRYRVYCEEFGYEPTEEMGNHQEMDDFDCQSIHCLVTHRESGAPAGCVRVILVDGNDRMPMELHAADSMDSTFMETFATRRDTLCEVSRLAVDGTFRRRGRERENRFGSADVISFTAQEQRTFPLIALSLFLGAGAAADILDRKNCFAIMEPLLAAMLKRSGVQFHRVGKDFEFRGVRAPYHANIDELFNSAPAELRQWFGAVRQQFASVLLPDAEESGTKKRVVRPHGRGHRPLFRPAWC